MQLFGAILFRISCQSCQDIASARTGTGSLWGMGKNIHPIRTNTVCTRARQFCFVASLFFVFLCSFCCFILCLSLKSFFAFLCFFYISFCLLFLRLCTVKHCFPFTVSTGWSSTMFECNRLHLLSGIRRFSKRVPPIPAENSITVQTACLLCPPPSNSLCTASSASFCIFPAAFRILLQLFRFFAHFPAFFSHLFPHFLHLSLSFPLLSASRSASSGKSSADSTSHPRPPSRAPSFVESPWIFSDCASQHFSFISIVRQPLCLPVSPII